MIEVMALMASKRPSSRGASSLASHCSESDCFNASA